MLLVLLISSIRADIMAVIMAVLGLAMSQFLKVGTNEKVGGSGRWQILFTASDLCDRCPFVFSF
jgi:hypothetical protein